MIIHCSREVYAQQLECLYRDAADSRNVQWLRLILH
jgi:hypothetical protein